MALLRLPILPGNTATRGAVPFIFRTTVLPAQAVQQQLAEVRAGLEEQRGAADLGGQRWRELEDGIRGLKGGLAGMTESLQRRKEVLKVGKGVHLGQDGLLPRCQEGEQALRCGEATGGGISRGASCCGSGRVQLLRILCHGWPAPGTPSKRKLPDHHLHTQSPPAG